MSTLISKQTVSAETISIEALDAIEVRPPVGTKVADNLTTYVGQFNAAQVVDNQCDVLRGYANWIQGQILLKIRPIDKKSPKNILHGQWDVFCKSVKVSRSNSWTFRKIADKFTKEQARTVGYAYMNGKVNPSKSKDGSSTAKFNENKVPSRIKHAREALRDIKTNLEKTVTSTKGLCFTFKAKTMTEEAIKHIETLKSELDYLLGDAASIKTMLETTLTTLATKGNFVGAVKGELVGAK